MAAIAVYTAVQPFLDVLSFAAGVVSAIYDDSPFKAIFKAEGDSAQGNYAAPFERQNAFAAGRGVGHAVSIVGGIVEVVAGGALVSGGTAVTTTGVLAPAGVAAVAGGAAIAAAGVARVATTVAAVSAGDPNFQLVKLTNGETASSAPLRGKEADEAAAKLGYSKTNYRSHGQPVYRKGNKYITPDVDGHNGGVWKMADSVEDLASKATRMGTYDANLIRIGD